jgi:hypothetical protein
MAACAMVVSSIAGVDASVGVTLAWDPNPEPDIACYKLYLGTSPRTYSMTYTVTSGTSCVVPNLEEGRNYYFAVKACNSAEIESAFSDEVCFSTMPHAWRAATFGAQASNPALESTLWGDLADPDRDGRSNLMEYALGTAGTVADSRQAITNAVLQSGGASYQALTFWRRNNDPTLAYIPMVSADRTVWSTNGIASSVVASVPDFDLVTYTDSVPVQVGQPRFFRLRVVRQ